MDQLENPNKPIFRNLDGIRCIAFLCIFFSHLFYSNDPVIKNSSLYLAISFIAGGWGDLGLSVFFVMSGFLITYLLMHEHFAYGKVHVFSFYARRILRIWPLYFAIVLFNFFVYAPLSHRSDFAANPMPYYFFYANMDALWHGFNNDVIGHLWAISVEEQFYLTLPLLMVVIPIRQLHYAFIAVIIVSQIFRIVHYQEPSVLFYHSLSASFDIAIGGLAAWLMYFNARAKNFITNLSPAVIIASYLIFISVILFQDFIFTKSLLVVSILINQLFAVFIILEQNYASASFLKAGNLKWVTTLGKYSFGLFCYHILCIRLVETIAFKMNISGVMTDVIIVPAAALILTIIVGVISFLVFEMRFLNLKKKFSYLK